MNTLDYLNNYGDRSFHRKSNESDGVIKSASTASVSSQLSASVETSILSEGTEGGRRVFSRSIEANFSLNISFERPEFELKVPSPADVAQTVLGFVERRISSEVEAGADNSRVSDLLAQARRGVEAGFASAISDIESLGLMNETLEEEIGESRSMINQGIDAIEEDRIGNNIADDSAVSAPLNTGVADETPEESSDVSETQQSTSLNVYDFFSQSNAYQGSSIESAPLESVSKYKFASQESSEFSLKTRDGDTVSIRFSDSFASVYQSSNGSQGLATVSNQAFEFSVEGELDESEVAAINELLAQVGQVADLFFENRFQDAFDSALSIGFDSSEIAAFSLDLSKAMMEEVRSYGGFGNANQGAELGAAKRYQPVVDMANHFSNIKNALDVFDSPRENVAGLINETLERVKELVSLVHEQLRPEETEQVSSGNPKVSISQLMEFSEYVLLSE